MKHQKKKIKQCQKYQKCFTYSDCYNYLNHKESSSEREQKRIRRFIIESNADLGFGRVLPIFLRVIAIY